MLSLKFFDDLLLAPAASCEIPFYGTTFVSLVVAFFYFFEVLLGLALQYGRDPLVNMRKIFEQSIFYVVVVFGLRKELLVLFE